MIVLLGLSSPNFCHFWWINYRNSKRASCWCACSLIKKNQSKILVIEFQLREDICASFQSFVLFVSVSPEIF
jgi:hypothetical protein